MNAMNPYIQAAGIGLGAYGAYKQNETAEKQYELALQAYQAEQERQRRQEQDQQQQQILSNMMAGGNYAQGMVKGAQNAYGDYSRRIGL